MPTSSTATPRKLYLLERNRLMVVLTVYGGRLLWLVAGPLVALELAVLLVALKQGWARQKVAGGGGCCATPPSCGAVATPYSWRGGGRTCPAPC